MCHFPVEPQFNVMVCNTWLALIAETDQRVGAFISGDWDDAEASALVDEIANLTESIRLLGVDTSIPRAAIVQQQRV